MKYTKITTWFLAIAMFMFGILKFVNPFKGWYTVQIVNSGLGQISYSMGIMGEIAVGVALFFCLINGQRISKKLYIFLTTISFLTIIIMMLTGVFVHLHPNVPADVLPLKIKPPYIPLFFLVVALSNIYLLINRNTQKTEGRPNS
ncbi:MULTISPECIES: hypothetical protein [Sphingobacterium]|uniref:DoxX family protein n=1 Tax=Sphingobacterium litopenaei TaxID=2763500 RepID=A0ABR7YFB2_9SPHI|nr:MULTISPECIES: hypothetical protein [Sphingobacterium]MBD1430008.1 hypothetical protein [Sphingobacterium litopenaei]NGM74555.1 hypothetical protein [Sphingobacterium sp. SGL-16]